MYRSILDFKPWMLVAGCVTCGLVNASELTIPNTFQSGTPAVAAEVNANFSATAAATNDQEDRIEVLEGTVDTLTADIAGLQATVTDLTGRIALLEGSTPGAVFSVDTYFATDLVFLFDDTGDLSIPAVDGNPTPAGTVGTGREWHPLPGLTDVTFTVPEDGTTVLLIGKGAAYYPYWSAYGSFEAGIVVDGAAAPEKGAMEEVTLVTDDTVSSDQVSWNILHTVQLDAGEHSFSVVVRSPHAGNEGSGAVGIDGRSSGDYPGLIKTTLIQVNL